MPKPPPFLVRRTQSNQLPVWREARQNGNLVSTFVGKIRGNTIPLKRDLEILTRARVEQIDGSKLRLNGDHYVLVKKYLDSIGF